MYFDYERFVNIFSSMVVGYRYDVVHSNNPNRDTSDEEFGIFDDIEMREMPPIPISFRCQYRYVELVLDESVCV